MGLGADALVGDAGGALRFRIRDLAPRDLDGVMAIEVVSFPSPWSRALYEEEIGRRFSDGIVAVDDPGESVAGYAVCWTVAGESHLLTIAVRPDARKRGLGRALVRECLRRSAKGGGRRMFLEVRPSNESAIRLYRDAGFRWAGIRKGYYSDTGEDAIVLVRDIEEQDGF